MLTFEDGFEAQNWIDKFASGICGCIIPGYFLGKPVMWGCTYAPFESYVRRVQVVKHL